jgi:hypothetical protein
MRTVSCFSRLNAWNTEQTVFLAGVSITRVKVGSPKWSRRHGSAAVCEKARIGNRLYMSVPIHGHAPYPQGRANEFPRSGPIVLERNWISLFLIASSLVYISTLFCIPPPTKMSAAHVLQMCLPDATNFFVNIPAWISVLQLAWHRPFCRKSAVTTQQQKF